MGVARLEQIIEGVDLHGALGVFELGVGGIDDDEPGIAAFTQCLAQGQPIIPGQIYVQEQDMGPA